ncbi:M23 family metallopeptidase [Anaerosinus sp.]|uniref:M23 family metallopeptidase n=1 Tax=Selenobaculum sp. TaxID=3074374 RepID=UPI0015ABE706
MTLKKVNYKKFLCVLLAFSFLAGITWCLLQQAPESKQLHEPLMEVEAVEELAPEEPALPANAEMEQYKNKHDEEKVPVSRANISQFIAPTHGVVTSEFGARGGRNHDGVDIANDLGTPILAAKDGKVSFTGWISGYGNTIIIEHKQGYTTLYGHLQSILVETDSIVKAGEPIATMGSTGNSTGPHLHFEVERDGVLMNPAIILNN